MLAIFFSTSLTGCKGEPPFFGSSYSIPVSHSLTVAQMIKAGNYCCDLSAIDSTTAVSCLLTEMHALESKKCQASFRCVFVAFDRPAYTEEVLAELKNKGLRPAKLDELLFFEAEYTNEQKSFPIVALAGCFGDGAPRAALISEYNRTNSSSRILAFSALDSKFGGICRFLAIEK